MKIGACALASAAFVAFCTPALATEPGWYLGLAVGYDNLQNENFKSVLGTSSIRFKDSGLYLLNGGYKWNFGLRTELEFGYTKHVVNSGSDTGGTENLSFMGNALYDIEIFPRWTLALGAGVGMGDVNEYVHYGFGPPNNRAAGADVGFEWQGIAGLSFAVSPGLEMYTEYHYRQIEIDSNYANLFVAPFHLSNTTEHAAVLGLRWSFGEPPPPPPPLPEPTPPPPPPAPKPPPPVKTLVVFFHFDKANLTAEAEQVVSDAVRAVKQDGYVLVKITGHTDTVGSDRYNYELSVRRAQTVRDEMVRQGVDGRSISFSGKSFHNLLVQTGRGVREPQNRRAVIDLGS